MNVKVFSGADGSVLVSFMAFAGYRGGVTVAAGDLAGDGHAQIVLGASTGDSQVETFDGQTGAELMGFAAFDAGFVGGVRVGVSGTNILAGAGAGGGPHVELFDGTSGNLEQSYFAFEVGYVNGIYVG